ncbi:NAD(P)-dependent alcohol dehydrogenase [Pasteurella atlantica]|uniref:NAD(P)-dependent alcohol dehydrogenase n=3 Tax=Pasteurellaceae TaxID=712 RepID=A0A1H7YKC0_9PAST|nr:MULTISPECIES: NAD(P)-dependent alcohol dehydrogenase [Pasteurella]MDP8033798.1 NAD(P)-dependent alcohol dehydrogenase [Pasteurella atlantica]MDP8035733.1 NAD(P)-dependent alcohol dehydrogenase [Pasteurella atlantica]MDP8037731.1 NAD(P)-dependent alcohol dehydrogenase [Pasteurella atlantica]MDP8048033.1 NAD(P)-dependent alcohol dehydrogenase [Pasteurella atlantica]MDP8050057.1 NAD(P)-dependent alcohol dehydrogenase [Pasteurella atlantica]
MKGFAMLKIGETGWIEKEAPKCGPMDAIVRPLAVSPCSSDIHTVWEGAIGERENMILGHEACGVVEEVGELVKDFKKGDRVMVAAITPDWGTVEAQGGFPMHSGGMLSGWKFSNFKDGVFGELFHVNHADANLAHLPDSIPPEEACMLSDMVPTGFHGVELADVQFGDVVLVVGIGPVGLMAVAGAALRGASRIICVGTRENCRKAAKGYGATDFIGYHEPIDEQVMKMTNGKGVDKAIIAGGTVDTFAPIINVLKPGGKIGNVNYLGRGASINIPRETWGVGMGHKQINGGLMPGGRLRLEKLASLIECGKLDVKPLLTHKFKGFEHVEEALLLMKDKPADLIKPVVVL